MYDIGRRIRELRKEKNISAKEVSIALGVSSAFISGIESGKNKCSIENLKRICDVMGIDLAEFFSAKNNDYGHVPSEIWEMVSKKENHPILRQLVKLLGRDLSGEVICEWLCLLNKTIGALKNKYDHNNYADAIKWVEEDLLGDKHKSILDEEQRQRLVEKFRQKFKEGSPPPPWGEN